MKYSGILSSVVFIFLTREMDWYQALSLALTFYFFLVLLDSIGKKIPFLEITVFYAFILWLAMPVVAYQIFNEFHELSALWITFMAIPAEDYFAFALPATVLFALGLRLPLYGNKWPMSRYNGNLKAYLSGKPYLGLYMIAIGFVATILVKVTPGAIRNIVQNFAFFTYVGMFYVIYSPFKHKLRVVLICAGLTISQSIASGMYGELVFVSAMSSLILLAGRKIGMVAKLAVIAAGVLLVFFIQSIKFEYRAGTWSGLERSADPALFGSLVWERITHPSDIFALERLFNLSVRANQGNIVSKVMAYVPKFEPYAHGETVLKATAAALVPRFLWPGKPQAGGAEMVCRFLGDCNAAMRGISYNIGPIGEAYVNFGPAGGAVFMFFYGLLFNFLFNRALLLSKGTPSLILWFPLLFIGFFSMETDVLSFINSFVKSAFFTYVMYKSAKLLLHVAL